jgi:type I restriction enzyme S subunit
MKKYENLKDGDVIVSDASEDWAGVGKCIEIINIEDKKVISGLHTLHLRPKSDDFILGIKGYIFNIYQVATNIKRLATGMKVYGISKPNLGRVLLPVPTEPEQILIKKKLDYASNDISQKQTKIRTLQRLKKSLMQNLLTGKVRVDMEAINKIISEQNDE